MHPVDFVRNWTGVTRTERSAAQEHFLQLCRVLDVPTPAEVDKDGSTYTFEKGAAKSTGGQGWADVWYRGHFAWEYKGPNKDLDKAYDQLLRYKDHLENPPLLVVSDLDRIVICTNFTNTTQAEHVIDLATFIDGDNLDTLRRMWTDPMSFRPRTPVEKVTEEAAEKFGRLAGSLGARGHDPHAVAHFLVQTLFCLFAEDIGLLPNRVFSRLLDFGRQDPAGLRDETAKLLAAMQSGGSYALERIPHVNGGLFREIDPLELTAEEIGMLAEASRLDWSQVEPAIFGTLFERSLDPAQRSQLGAHYTGRADIERVVEPVVMAPLRRRWEAVRADLEGLVARRDAAKSAGARTQAQNRIREALQAFTGELRGVTILDPACGSGNFLYVALNALLDLEKEANLWGATEGGLPMGLPGVGPGQVRGLELSPYAQELAQAVIWIGYLQWLRRNGFGWREPVLESLGNIRLQDALLEERAGDGHGDRPYTRTIWPAADYIIGNPPFLGAKVLRSELGDEYTEQLHRVYKGLLPPFSDLACYFFEQAREAIAEDRTERAGLLATNSIRGGANREVLKRIKESGDIFMAWSDEPWVLNGAAVRISIVAFDDGTEESRCLDGEPVGVINSSLRASTVDLSAAMRLVENATIGFQGDTKGGPFEIEGDLAQSLLDKRGNPNGRQNSDVVKPWITGKDITSRPQRMWIIDFGSEMTLEQAALYEAPFEYALEHVKPKRVGNRVARTAERWWIHRRPVVPMREGIAGLSRYLGTTRHAKYRLFTWLPPGSIPDSALVVFAREDDYFFGVLHSRAHEVWSLRMGTWLGKGNDPRYTPTTTFETFPLPWPPGQEPVDDPRVVAIAGAAKELDRLRENWLNPPDASEAELKKRTLTNLYNTRPTWLANAHAALDRAVWAAYGWPAAEVPAQVAEDIILARLLEMNRERAG